MKRLSLILTFVSLGILFSTNAQDRIVTARITYDTIPCIILAVFDSSLVFSRTGTASTDTLAFDQIAKCLFAVAGDTIIKPRMVFDTISCSIVAVEKNKVRIITGDGLSKSYLKRDIFICQFEESPYQENISVFREKNRNLPYSTLRLTDSKLRTVKGAKMKAKLIAVTNDEITVLIRYRNKPDSVISKKENILFIQFNEFYFDEDKNYSTDFLLSKQGTLFGAKVDKIERDKILIKKQGLSGTAIFEESKRNISGLFFNDFTTPPPNNVRYNKHDFSRVEFSFGGGYSFQINGNKNGLYANAAINLYILKNLGWGLFYKYIKTSGTIRYLGEPISTIIHNHFFGTSVVYRARLTRSLYNKFFFIPGYLFTREVFRGGSNDIVKKINTIGLNFTNRIGLEIKHDFGGYLEFSYLWASEKWSGSSKGLSRIEIGIGISFGL